MTLSDLLDGSFAVIKASPRKVFTIAAVILVPVHLAMAYLSRDLGAQTSIDTTFNALNAGSSPVVSDSAIVLAYLGAAISALSLFFLGGAIARLVSAWYAGSDVSAGEALGAAFTRTPAILTAFVVLLLAKIAGVFACYVGMIFVVAVFSLTAPALVVEHLGPMAAAARSWRLITRRFWPCLGIVVLASLGASLLTTVIGGIPSLLASLLPAPFDWIGSAAVSAGVSMLVTTALVSVSVLMYLDLRIRTEGLDIELAAADAFAGTA